MSVKMEVCPNCGNTARKARCGAVWVLLSKYKDHCFRSDNSQHVQSFLIKSASFILSFWGSIGINQCLDNGSIGLDVKGRNIIIAGFLFQVNRFGTDLFLWCIILAVALLTTHVLWDARPRTFLIKVVSGPHIWSSFFIYQYLGGKSARNEQS